MEIVKLLKEKGFKITAAESCTGGLVAKMITDIPGASEVFHAGFVVYSNEMKIKLLGVKAETIKNYGAVSEQCAKEMASGALNAAGADISISITGIAGPDGGSAEKPVGTVYIGLCSKNIITAEKFLFSGGREDIRRQSAEKSLVIAAEHIMLNY